VNPFTPTPAPANTVPALPGDAVEVGRILGAWGIKGGIKVKPFAADVQALFSCKRWYLQPAEPPRPTPPNAPPLPPLLRVLQAREHADGVVATAQEVPDRTAAEALQGARVFVSRASFPTPPDGEFYWVDLIGLTVRNREDALLGQVVGLLETGPHCVLRVQGADAQADEVLIPFVAAYVDQVDLSGRSLRVDWQANY
jgi:16S rRNA processing protein RimM